MSKRDDKQKLQPVHGLEALQGRDMRWYLDSEDTPPEEKATKLATVAKAIRKNDYSRQQNYLRYWSLYSNLPLLGLTPRRYTQTQTNQSRERLALNVIKSCSDSFVAKLTNEQPRVSCVTQGGDWDLQQRAERLTTFLDGIFYETKFYETAPLAALDMSVFGTGSVTVTSEGEGEHEHIVIKRKLPGESCVDDESAYDGDPRERYYSTYVDRLVAIGIFAKNDGELAAKLAVVPRDREDDQGEIADGEYTDTIRLDEAWHLPSFPGANDGRHRIACGNVLILDEQWNKQTFPFVDLYRQKPQCGIWGVGLAEELQGIQFEINVILNMIRRAIRMSGTLRWMVENGSDVNTQYITDIIGSILRYSGTAPIPITPPAVAGEVYEQLLRLYQWAYEITGVSQLSATSTAPANEESGRAKELRLDTESERFSVAFSQYQQFFLKVAREVIALAREIADRNPSFKVRAVGRQKMMEVVKWADIHLEDEEFILQMVPTNKKATDPSAHMQDVLNWLNAGAIGVRGAQRLMQDNPDFAEELSYQNASYNLTMDMISDILRKGEFRPPEPMMNLDPTKEDNAITLFQQAYLKARRSKVPEERLEMMRQWMEMAVDMGKAPANESQSGAAPGAPPAPPVVPPPPTPPQGNNGAPPMAA